MMHTLLTRSVASRICQNSWLRGQGFYNISFVTGKNTYRYTQGDETFLSIVCFSLKKNNSCRQLKCNYLNVDLSWSETSYSGITEMQKEILINFWPPSKPKSFFSHNVRHHETWYRNWAQIGDNGWDLCSPCVTPNKKKLSVHNRKLETPQHLWSYNFQRI